MLAWTRHLLKFSGVLTKAVVQAFSPFDWETHLAALSRMEELGYVTRGLLVRGIRALQFADKDTAERLREPAFAANGGFGRQEDIVLLNSADPANPFGLIIDWPTDTADEHKPAVAFARKPGNYLLLKDGRFHLWVANNGRNVSVVDSSDSPNPSGSSDSSSSLDSSSPASLSDSANPATPDAPINLSDLANPAHLENSIKTTVNSMNSINPTNPLTSTNPVNPTNPLNRKKPSTPANSSTSISLNPSLAAEYVRFTARYLIRERGLRKVVIESWNGQPVDRTELGEHLAKLGAEKDGRAYVLWPSSV